MANQAVGSRRLFSLDVLRGIAILLVLVNHMPMRPEAGSFVEKVVGALSQVGWVGVDLFFVLSGFLISRLLFQELKRTGSLEVRRFWLRRGFKTWPSYFVAFGGMVVVTLVVEHLAPGSR